MISSTVSKVLLTEILRSSSAAYAKLLTGEGVWKDAAAQIKKDLDANEKSGVLWHVICGSSFGTFEASISE